MDTLVGRAVPVPRVMSAAAARVRVRRAVGSKGQSRGVPFGKGVNRLERGVVHHARVHKVNHHVVRVVLRIEKTAKALRRAEEEGAVDEIGPPSRL